MNCDKTARMYGRAQRLREVVDAMRKDLDGERSDLARTLNAVATQVEMAARSMAHVLDEQPKPQGGAVRGTDGGPRSG